MQLPLLAVAARAGFMIVPVVCRAPLDRAVGVALLGCATDRAGRRTNKDADGWRQNAWAQEEDAH